MSKNKRFRHRGNTSKLAVMGFQKMVTARPSKYNTTKSMWRISMNIKPIRSDEDLRDTFKRLETVFQAKEGNAPKKTASIICNPQ